MADSRCTETRGDQREVNNARTRHYRTDKAGVNASATATEQTRDPVDTVQHAPINGTPEKTETPDIVIHVNAAAACCAVTITVITVSIAITITINSSLALNVRRLRLTFALDSSKDDFSISDHNHALGWLGFRHLRCIHVHFDAWGPPLTDTADMDSQPLDSSSCFISASLLREKPTTSPLRPVVALHASIELSLAYYLIMQSLTSISFSFVPGKIPPRSSKKWDISSSIPALWPLIAAYLVWMTWIDKSPEHRTRLSPWFHSLKIWEYFADYYPVSLLKECDLPPDHPYVFGYHPHGIIGMGAMATFATEATGFSSAFPGICPHLLTLTNNFDVPIYREILMALRISSVSKQSCSNILKCGPGEAITIVVGGATESLSACPGFIKAAIQHGADLVPVFSFGENDIYQQMPNEKGTTIYALQKRFQRMFGFTLPLLHGQGLLNYNLGLLPYHCRIVSVIGRPIHIEKCEKPTLDEVTRIQMKYIEELTTRIWNTYKDEFTKTHTRELNIID
ncbi:hypothetical protein SCLCIDRAFT_20629 [Scleroderma citrinum Foug A]|uniref:diacylglycerol O-acyltransferase n=1 Tax=Scleroderma citrinum Foug A TaxID=1036808 RepID=A0A0C3E634_9AGAM|nr:hypothetical protein SCLCIDRAFT_20629 [Scleroderma citrinum Foug A]